MLYLSRCNDLICIWKHDGSNITLANRFSWGRKHNIIRVSVPSSNSVDFAEYNGVKQLSITESNVESRASEARIPEPQFPSLLLSLAAHYPPSPALVRFSPLRSGKTRRRLISVAPLNAFSCQSEHLSDLLLRHALCVPSIRNENRLICRRMKGHGGRFSFRFSEHGSSVFWISLLRGVTLRFFRLPRVTLRAFPFAIRTLRFVRSAKSNLHPSSPISKSFLDTVIRK